MLKLKQNNLSCRTINGERIEIMINYAESQASWYYQKMIENRYWLDFGFGLGSLQSEKIFSEQFEYWSKNETVNPEILAKIIEWADEKLIKDHPTLLPPTEERIKAARQGEIIKQIIFWVIFVIVTLMTV